jgi:uncharacterized protein (TIGR01244 family)
MTWRRAGPALVLVLAAGCASRPEAPPAIVPARAPHVAAVAPRALPNFGRVDDGLFRCGRLTREGVADAKRLGVRTVVNLRSEHDDRALLAGSGIDYVHLPMRAWSVDAHDVDAFLRVATDPARRPVLVHCAHGCDRTGACVAAYRVAYQGWTREAASAEMKSFGSASIFRSCRVVPWTLDVEATRARVAALPAPAVERL